MILATAQPDMARLDPLDPVRRALLDDARRDVDAMLAQADTEAAAIREDAGARAREIRESAVSLGEDDAAATLRAERTRARRRARQLLLGAQRDMYDELRRAALERAALLRQEPGYSRAIEGLTARARDDLGPDAAVTDHPSGGVVAEANGRHVSFTVESLVDEALGSLGADLEGLWDR